MPNIEFLEEQRFTVSSHLIDVALNHKLSLNDFLLLMYFENSKNKLFDVNIITDTLSLNEDDILNSFNHLLTLNLIKLETIKDNTIKCFEKISLVPLYQALVSKVERKQKEQQKETIYDIFQKEFGRKLSPMEYEYINAWLEKGFGEELVCEALKESVYNGVKSFRYIDSKLYEWQKKGYKSKEDVIKGLKSKENKHQELFDYNWLEDE